MDRRFTFRQVAAVAALSAAAGFGSARTCAPKAEDITRAADPGCQTAILADPSFQLLDLISERAVRQSAPALRSELGAGSHDELAIGFHLLIGKDGSLALLRATPYCGGERCGADSELPAIIGTLLAKEWTVRPQQSACDIEIMARVPAAEAENRRFFPGRQRGNGLVDL